ncbi:MAG: EAL domain-containing protein, partial [Pseudomonadota bacterium]
KVSFNLAVSRILDPSLGQELSRLKEFGTTPTVELLESMSLDQLDPKFAMAIDSLKEQGLPIEIDDFGSCRASIVGLLNVGPTRLKIDQQLIMPMLKSPLQQQLVRAIIEIGRALDIGVVAEGVETFEHCQALSDLGCDILQGYALAKPMDIQALQVFLKNEPWRVAHSEWNKDRLGPSANLAS